MLQRERTSENYKAKWFQAQKNRTSPATAVSTVQSRPACSKTLSFLLCLDNAQHNRLVVAFVHLSQHQFFDLWQFSILYMIYHQQMYHNGKIKKQKKIANFATKILSWLPHMNVDSKQICKKNTVKLFTVVLYVEDISQTKFSKSDQNEMFGIFLSSGGAYGALRNILILNLPTNSYKFYNNKRYQQKTTNLPTIKLYQTNIKEKLQIYQQ